MAAVSGSPPVAERRRRRDRTRWGPDDDGDATAPAAPSETQIPADPTAAATLQPAPAAPRPKRSRWASEDTDVKAVVPGLPVPVSLPPSLAGLVDANPQAMLLHRQLSAISQRLSELSAPGNLEVADDELRSPSPEPQYNELGVRVNTRAHRLKQKLTTQAQDTVTELLKISPGFKPPPEFRPAKKQRKVFVPVQQYPGYNFIGLIIGPRGNTQKRMQQESGAKIALRGRGSIKDGRGGRSAFDPSENEELHVLITADTEQSLEKASEMVQQLMVPLEEGVNEHKRMQLRELAELNGTLRDSEMQELHGQGRGADGFQLPPALQEAANRQYDRDVAAVHPQQPHEPMDHAYHEFIQELGSGPAPWNPKAPEQGPGGQQGLRNRDDNSPCNLFVGCIPAGMDEPSLRSLFEPSGQIAECHLVLDRISGQHRGFGFVKMAHEQGAVDAIERLHNFVLGGRKLVVRHKHGSQPFSSLLSASSLPPAPQANGMDLAPPLSGVSSDQLPPPPVQLPSGIPPESLPPPPHLAPSGQPHLGPQRQSFFPPAAISSPAALPVQPLEPAEDRPPGMEADRPHDAEEPLGAELAPPQDDGGPSQAHAGHPYALPHADSGSFMQPPMQQAPHGYHYPPYSHPAEHPESLAVAAHHAQLPVPGFTPHELYSMPHPAEQPYPYAHPYPEAHAAQQHYDVQQHFAEQQQQEQEQQDDDLRPPGAEEEDELLPPGYEPAAAEQPQQPPDGYSAQEPDIYAAQQASHAYNYAAGDEEADAHAPGTEDTEMVPPPPPPPPEPPKKAVQVVKVPLPPPSETPAPADDTKIVPPTVKLRVPRRVAERAAQQKQKREQQQAAAPPAPATQQEEPEAAVAEVQPPSPKPAAGPPAAAVHRRSPLRSLSPTPPSPQTEPRRSSRGGRKLRRKASPSPSPVPAPARSRSPAVKRKAHAPKDKDRKRSKRSRKASPVRGSSKRRSQRRTASPSATPEDLGELQSAAPAAKARQEPAAAAEAGAKRSSEGRGRAASPRKRRKATRWKADSPPPPAAAEASPEAQPAAVPAEPPRPATPELSEEGEIPMEEGQLPPEEATARSASPASRRLPSPPRRTQPQHAAPTSPRGLDARRRSSGLTHPQAESPSFARRMDGNRRMSDTGTPRARSPPPGAGSWHRQNSQGSGWSDSKRSAYGQRRSSFEGAAVERTGLPPPPLRRTTGSGSLAQTSISGFAGDQGSRQQQGWGGPANMMTGHPQQQQQQQAMLSRGMGITGSSPYGVYGMLPMAEVAGPIMPNPGMAGAPRGLAQWSARY